jgi:acetyltransferase EpsM
VVLDVIRAGGSECEIVFADSNAHEAGLRFPEYTVHSLEAGLNLLDRGSDRFVIAIGNNAVRSKCYGELVSQRLQPAACPIHPSAVVSPSASIGPGTVVMPRAVINAHAEIGEDCIINTGAIVEHDCAIGAHAHISPGATLGGGVQVGAGAHIGLNACILPGLTVSSGAVVGAGAVVTQSVPENVVVAGVPARLQSLRKAS